MKAITWFLKDEFPKHIEALEADRKPLWGLMSAQHLIEHLTILFNVSNGKAITSQITTTEQMEKSKRHVFIYKNPFPKNLRVPIMPEKPAALIFPDIEKAKEVMWKSVDLFYQHYEGRAEHTEVHPVLGPLTFEEWAFFHTKHCSHHLTQFGLMEGELTP